MAVGPNIKIHQNKSTATNGIPLSSQAHAKLISTSALDYTNTRPAAKTHIVVPGPVFEFPQPAVTEETAAGTDD